MCRSEAEGGVRLEVAACLEVNLGNLFCLELHFVNIHLTQCTAAKVLGMTGGNFGRSNFRQPGMCNKLNDPSRCSEGCDFPCTGSAIMM